MKADRSWRCVCRKRSFSFGGGKCMLKMKRLPLVCLLCAFMLIVLYSLANCQHWQTQLESRMHLFGMDEEFSAIHTSVGSLPRGIIHSTSDLELKPLWSKSSSRLKSGISRHQNILAISVGVKQKYNVNKMVHKFLPENFMVVLFHYDGDVDGWRVFDWSNRAIHIVGQNQTKWWFAKRFLHPSIVSIYDYVFLWDEDLGVENFDPGRYLNIITSEGLEISQPALDPNSTEIHHRITIRKRTKKVHRRVYELRGNVRCSESSLSPPCTGWVEGMAPVFSRSAWQCAWHLIQNDLVHGWGLDMKLGYCAQGDRTKKVGIIDSEYIVHQGIQTLGGTSLSKRNGNSAPDERAEIRRQSTWELQTFKDRWEQAVREDRRWTDPFRSKRMKKSSS